MPVHNQPANSLESPAAVPDCVTPGAYRRLWATRKFKLGLIFGAGILVATGLLLVLRAGPQKGHAQGPGKIPSPLDKWNKPDLVLIVSGQMYGYIQPCGCSKPQFGGLARRFNFLQSLKDKGWPVVSVDLGDIAQRSGPQALLK